MRNDTKDVLLHLRWVNCQGFLGAVPLCLPRGGRNTKYLKTIIKDWKDFPHQLRSNKYGQEKRNKK